MKKAALLLIVVLLAACSHRSDAIKSVDAAPAQATSVVSTLLSPPVTSEPPSFELVEAPAPSTPIEQREAAGRFLQRIAYHTRVRESLTKAPVQSVTSTAARFETRDASRSLLAPQPLPSAREVNPIMRVQSNAPRYSLKFSALLLGCVILVIGVAFERSRLT